MTQDQKTGSWDPAVSDAMGAIRETIITGKNLSFQGSKWHTHSAAHADPIQGLNEWHLHHSFSYWVAVNGLDLGLCVVSRLGGGFMLWYSSLSLKFWMTPTLSSFNSVLRRNNNLPRSGALLALGSNWLHDNSIIFATQVQFCFASCYVVCCLRVLTLDLGSFLGSVHKPKFTFSREGENMWKVLCDLWLVSFRVIHSLQLLMLFMDLAKFMNIGYWVNLNILHALTIDTLHLVHLT